MNATVIAVRHVCCLLLSRVGRTGDLGKKTRNKSNLHERRSQHINIPLRIRRITYIILKQNHCTPTCAIPSRPAAHSKVLTVLQQATSAREAGSTSMFAKAQVPDVVPRRMKNGEIPSEVLRLMIR